MHKCLFVFFCIVWEKSTNFNASIPIGNNQPNNVTTTGVNLLDGTNATETTGNASIDETVSFLIEFKTFADMEANVAIFLLNTNTLNIF